MIFNKFCTPIRIGPSLVWALFLVGLPLVLAVWVLGLSGWDLSIPLVSRNADDIWQLALTKMLYETGWVLTNPFLGAPEIAHWHHNSAAQTSALHSLLMLAMTPFVHDAIQLQQIYFVLNFPLICFTSFIACRLLGIERLPAFCAGLLFAFTPLRFNEMFYAFIPNYFMIPLALVVVIWVVSGRFSVLVDKQECSEGGRSKIGYLFRSREFWLGLIFVVLTTISDGYYAFFTLLLMCFSALSRLLMGDWRRPLALLPVVIYISTILVLSLSLQFPLQNFKKTHRSEFYPSGIVDPVLTKHPVEAEIYSSSLKLSIAPISQHRIEVLGKLGKWIVETRDEAFIVKRGNAYVPFGTLGSILFIAALALITIPALKTRISIFTNDKALLGTVSPQNLLDALLSLIIFIFLCSIAGGIGTLVALVFPTIRAYDRFPLFIVFSLYIGFVMSVGLCIKATGGWVKMRWTAFLIIVTAVALFDQIPRNASKGDELIKSKFLAERNFVHRIESELDKNSMVYQYPYSQYLRQSKYYGWGAFTHIRLYLHSHYLRWSNGGAKNSPGDDWNFRISQLPLKDMIAEIEALGFSGFVIDRAVLNFDEYKDFSRYFSSNGYKMDEDSLSNLTFVRLKDPGYKLYYDDSYQDVDRVVVTDPQLLAKSKFPVLINGDVFRNYVTSRSENEKLVIRKSEHPEIFVDGSVFSRGSGQSAIVPISDMVGRMSCKVDNTTGEGVVELAVNNLSQFNWKLGEGSFPLRIGVHIRKRDGSILRFDDGFRVPSEAYVRKGSSEFIRLPINRISLGADVIGNGPLMVEFVMMQDGNAWFGNISCTIPLP